MAVFELEEPISEPSGSTGALTVLRRVPAAARRWVLRRRTVAQLSRLSEHLRRDVGLERADAYDPLDGGASSLWKQSQAAPALAPHSPQPRSSRKST